MGAGHGGGSHAYPGGRHRWRLAAAFALAAGYFVVELGVGLWAGSLSLVSDAGHMAADVVALGAALAATRIASRADTTGRRTYGSYRAEVFASGFTVLIMVGVAAYIGFEAVGRIGSPPEHIPTGPVMLVGAVGLGVNLAALALLRGGSTENLGVKGAYLEVLADTLGSVGVIVAGALVAWTGNPAWDTGVAVAIALFVAVRAVLLGREVLAVLGQHAPGGINPHEVATQLQSVPGVRQVHDLHLWSLTSGMNVATAHLVIDPAADSQRTLTAARDVMRTEFGVEHATLQVESTEADCHEISW